MMSRLKQRHGWQVVSDTSYAGYKGIPRDVMQGYATIAAEIIEQTGSHQEQPAYTHIFSQGGVGGLAAGLARYLWEFHGHQRPRLSWSSLNKPIASFKARSRELYWLLRSSGHLKHTNPTFMSTEIRLL